MGSTQQFENQLIYRFNLQNSMSVTPGIAHCSVAQRLRNPVKNQCFSNFSISRKPKSYVHFCGPPNTLKMNKTRDGLHANEICKSFIHVGACRKISQKASVEIVGYYITKVVLQFPS